MVSTRARSSISPRRYYARLDPTRRARRGSLRCRTGCQVEAVKLLSAGQNTEGVEPFVRFRELIFGHLAPLIEMLAERTSVTRRVYWSNVGDAFETMLRRIEQIGGRLPRLEAQDILEQQTWPGNQANPLFNAVIYKASNPIPRVRRICCLQYLLPDRRFCSACPVTCRSEK
jgi:ferric iron reductase protein FhuF